ncbi:prepilin peptidase [Candidatus Atribacteria bacterium MT.SAG.1]|nr:prepilin peptidase [Candidatus Atribacteria bacterium MT.SAG.1]
MIMIYLIIFIFGTFIGSFLNCVIYRLENKQSFLKGRSFCPECKHKLYFFDLIPVFSFIFLKGKCRYCEKRISFQYPLMEIIIGLLFLLILNFQFGYSQFSILNLLTSIRFLYLLTASSLLIIVFIYDLKHYIIPDKVIYPLIGITFFYQLIYNFQAVDSSFWSFFLSALGAAGFFFFIWFFSKGKCMGFGDVNLAFFMGLFLGWPNILTALFSAFFIGAIIGIGLIILGRKKLKSQVPFGPFLITGTFIALFWGQNLINWYLDFLLL